MSSVPPLRLGYYFAGERGTMKNNSPPPAIRRRPAMLLAVLAVALVAGCGRQAAVAPSAGGSSGSAAAGASPVGAGAAGDADKVLNVYNWSDYIDPGIVPAFEKEYRIKVNYDVFDSNEVL